MQKYVIRFGMSYAILTVVLAGLTYLIDTGAALNFVAAMGASFMAASAFVKDQGRLPTAEEKSSYTWGALGISYLISFLLVAIAFGFLLTAEEIAALKPMLSSSFFLGVAFIGLIITSAIYYLVIRWAFSWYAGMAVR